MRLTATAAAALLASSSSTTSAFTVVQQSRHLQAHRLSLNRHQAVPRRDLSEFDYLLRETSDASSTSTGAPISSRRRIVLPDSQDTRTTVLASASFPGAPTSEMVEEEGATDDPYANAFDSQMGKIQTYQEKAQTNTLETKIKSMDLQDIVLTFVLPAIVVFAGTRWVLNRVGGKVADKTDVLLDNFAREMLYYDGDFKEMELCIKDFKTKLVWMGPAKGDAMLKRYLEAYAKKKTVSPQAIASLSHVFTVFKLSEEKAAKILVQLCQQMGTDKISSSGKLLFLGSRILKSPEGAKALEPIKKLIMSTYREESVAETMIESSQQAIAEAAYRTTVLEAGKKQKGLTPGWDVLGLDKETATRIFDEAKEQGFVSDRVTMYGGQTRKYDKKGRQLDEEGKLANPEEAEEDEDDDEVEVSASNVYECGNCGFTLFVAQGRESKFYGTGFKCPECGAPKKDFIARDEEDE